MGKRIKDPNQVSLFDIVQPYTVIDSGKQLEDMYDTFIAVVGYETSRERIDIEQLCGRSRNELKSHFNHVLGKDYNFLEIYTISEYQEKFDINGNRK